jgi:hypothetical protein
MRGPAVSTAPVSRRLPDGTIGYEIPLDGTAVIEVGGGVKFEAFADTERGLLVVRKVQPKPEPYRPLTSLQKFTRKHWRLVWWCLGWLGLIDLAFDIVTLTYWSPSLNPRLRDWLIENDYLYLLGKK